MEGTKVKFKGDKWYCNEWSTTPPKAVIIKEFLGFDITMNLLGEDAKEVINQIVTVNGKDYFSDKRK